MVRRVPRPTLRIKRAKLGVPAGAPDKRAPIGRMMSWRSDGKRYIVQTDGSVPLPVSLACVVTGDGRSSGSVIVTVKTGLDLDGPGIVLPAK